MHDIPTVWTPYDPSKPLFQSESILHDLDKSLLHFSDGNFENHLEIVFGLQEVISFMERADSASVCH